MRHKVTSTTAEPDEQPALERPHPCGSRNLRKRFCPGSLKALGRQGHWPEALALLAELRVGLSEIRALGHLRLSGPEGESQSLVV